MTDKICDPVWCLQKVKVCTIWFWRQNAEARMQVKVARYFQGSNCDVMVPKLQVFLYFQVVPAGVVSASKANENEN